MFIHFNAKNIENLKYAKHKSEIQPFSSSKFVANAANHHWLTEDEVQFYGAKSVNISEFKCGYTLPLYDSIIIDTDTTLASQHILTLVDFVKEKIYISGKLKENELKLHIFVELYTGTNCFMAKQNITSQIIGKFEIMANGAHVFDSNGENGEYLSNYYPRYKGSKRENIQQLTYDESIFLIQSLKNHYSEANGRTFSIKDSKKYPVIDNPDLARYVNRCLEENTILPFIDEFKRKFKSFIGLNSPYDAFEYIDKGSRNSTLVAITMYLFRCIQLESREDIVRFVNLIREELTFPIYPEEEFNKSINVKRNFAWFDLSDEVKSNAALTTMKLARKTTENSHIYYELAIVDNSIIDKYDDTLMVIPISKEVSLTLFNLGSSKEEIESRVIDFKDLNTQYLSATYFADNTANRKEGKAGEVKSLCVDYQKFTRLKFYKTKRISPLIPVIDDYTKKDLAINFASTGYSKYARFNSQAKYKLKQFLNIPAIKAAYINLFNSNLYKMAEFFSNFFICIKNNIPTKKGFIFIGEGGIGKDKFMEFLHKCLFSTSASYTVTSAHSFLDETKFNYKKASSYSIVINELGEDTSIATKLLNEANSYIDNTSIDSTQKFKETTTHMLNLLSFVIFSNNHIEIDTSYNNTRFSYFVCNGELQFRTNEQLSKEFFEGLTIEEQAEKYGDIVCNFILFNDFFYRLANRNKVKKDDTSFIKQNSYEDELSLFVEELDTAKETGSLDMILERVKTRKSKLPANQLEEVENILIYNLYFNLGLTPPSYLMDAKGKHLTLTYHRQKRAVKRIEKWVLLIYRERGISERLVRQKAVDFRHHSFMKSLFKMDIDTQTLEFKPKILEYYKNKLEGEKQ